MEHRQIIYAEHKTSIGECNTRKNITKNSTNIRKDQAQVPSVHWMLHVSRGGGDIITSPVKPKPPNMLTETNAPSAVISGYVNWSKRSEVCHAGPRGVRGCGPKHSSAGQRIMMMS